MGEVAKGQERAKARKHQASLPVAATPPAIEDRDALFTRQGREAPKTADSRRRKKQRPVLEQKKQQAHLQAHPRVGNLQQSIDVCRHPSIATRRRKRATAGKRGVGRRGQKCRFASREPGQGAFGRAIPECHPRDGIGESNRDENPAHGRDDTPVRRPMALKPAEFPSDWNGDPMRERAELISEGSRSVRRHWRRWALGMLALVFVATRVAAIFTVSLNWDEFALLDGAVRTAETGVLHSGGRPGLATIALLPWVSGCDDEIQVIRHARLLWLAITLAFLAGLGALLAQLQPDPQRRWGDAALGVALLACVPAFLEWSIQIRSDQIALAAGVWGGAALLASRTSPRKALVALTAGGLFGLGFLASQKLIYVAALSGLLALGQLGLRREWRPKREILRVGLSLVGFGLVFSVYRIAVAHAFSVPEIHESQQVMSSVLLKRNLSVFDFYRQTVGYDQYRSILPSLWAHGLLLTGLIAASIVSMRRHSRSREALALAWCVLLLGVLVGWFHAGAFFYFWMTLGLFPAVAFATARLPMQALLPKTTGHVALAGVGVVLALPALFQLNAMRIDSQSVQRESLAFIHRNFAGTEAGFHPESAPFCRPGPAAISSHFSETIYRRFGGSERQANTEKMIRTFETEPIRFILQSFRLNQFPVELRRFWSEHYQPYNASVFVAGRRLEGAAGTTRVFGLIVPGLYRWLPFEGFQSIRIDDQLVSAGNVVSLAPASHTANFVEDGPGGVLVLALQDPPSLAPQPFYKFY